MAQTAFVPVTSSSESQPLKSPYDKHPAALVEPGQDFTVRLTTISKSILDKYGNRMFRGQYDNDYFALLTHFGIGHNGDGKPSTSINHVAKENSVSKDILSLWAENIRFIKDYRAIGTDGDAGKVYIGTTAMCQSLGKSSVDNVLEASKQVVDLVGRFVPWLTPYTTVGKVAAEGVAYLLKKIINNHSQCITSQLSLYPATLDTPLPQGDAYLQQGSYVLFFEDVKPADISSLSLTREGELVATQRSGISVPPYTVINLVDGIVDGPSEVFQKSVAVDVLEKYENRNDFISSSNSRSQSLSFLAEGLQKVGESYYYMRQIRRYHELYNNRHRSQKEDLRMASIKEEIESAYPTLKMES